MSEERVMCYEKSKDGPRLHFIEFDTILKWTLDDDELAFYTTSGELYYMITNLEKASSVLKDRNFDEVDRSDLARMDKIVEFDKEQRIATFEGGLTTSVSRAHKNKISNLPHVKLKDAAKSKNSNRILQAIMDRHKKKDEVEE